MKGASAQNTGGGRKRPGRPVARRPTKAPSGLGWTAHRLYHFWTVSPGRCPMRKMASAAPAAWSARRVHVLDRARWTHRRGAAGERGSWRSHAPPPAPALHAADGCRGARGSTAPMSGDRARADDLGGDESFHGAGARLRDRLSTSAIVACSAAARARARSRPLRSPPRERPAPRPCATPRRCSGRRARRPSPPPRTGSPAAMDSPARGDATRAIGHRSSPARPRRRRAHRATPLSLGTVRGPPPGAGVFAKVSVLCVTRRVDRRRGRLLRRPRHGRDRVDALGASPPPSPRRRCTTRGRRRRPG